MPRKIQDFISFDLFLGTFDWLIGKCTDCFCQFGAGDISDLPWNVDCEGIDDDDNDRNWQKKVLTACQGRFLVNQINLLSPDMTGLRCQVHLCHRYFHNFAKTSHSTKICREIVNQMKMNISNIVAMKRLKLDQIELELGPRVGGRDCMD